MNTGSAAVSMLSQPSGTILATQSGVPLVVRAQGLQIRHAIVRGPMLPGIVSLWEPVGGPAAGIPYVVFPGNVGDDRALLDVVRILAGTS